MRMIALPVVLAALLSAGCANAQGQPPAGGQPSQQQGTPEQRFLEFDTNKDSKITKQEFLAVFEQRWLRMVERLDTSKDGVVSKEEFLATPKPPQSGGQQQPPR